MEYVFLIFCVLLFALFGIYIMNKIDHFLESGDFKFYKDDEEINNHSKAKQKKLKK